VAGPVVVVQVGDEGHRDLRRLHPRALHHGGRAHVVADPARLRIIVEEPGVDEDGMRPPEDQPDEIVQGEGRVRRLTIEELAGRRIPLPVLERVHLVHDSPPNFAWLMGDSLPPTAITSGRGATTATFTTSRGTAPAHAILSYEPVRPAVRMSSQRVRAPVEGSRQFRISPVIRPPHAGRYCTVVKRPKRLELGGEG